MKTPILLVLVIIGACYAQDGYTEVSPDQYNVDPLFPTLRDYGTNAILDRALAAGRITDKATFQVDIINHVYIRTTATFLYYRYDLSLINDNGDIITTIFTVQYRLRNQAMSLGGLSYAVDYNSPAIVEPSTGNTNTSDSGTTTDTTTGTPTDSTNGGFVSIPESEYTTNEVIQSLIEYGKNHVVTRGVQLGRIPAGDYAVTAVYSVEKQTVSSRADNYRFTIDFEKSDGTRTVESTFTINYRPATDRKAVTGFNLAVLPFRPI